MLSGVSLFVYSCVKYTINLLNTQISSNALLTKKEGLWDDFFLMSSGTVYRTLLVIVLLPKCIQSHTRIEL